MSAGQSPSKLLGTFVRTVQKSFPQDQLSALGAYSNAIAETTSRRDPERARHCALWAIEKADDRNQSHPRWREIKELHQIWKDTWFGAEFGLMGAGGTSRSPSLDVHIQWIEDAVLVAKTLGEEDGWDHSPWEDLLQELIEMEKK